MAVETKEQVKALLDEGKSAKEIAEALNKTPATVYSHIANIRKESGDTTPRKRGRPPKAQTDETGTQTTEAEAKPAAARPKPGAKADSKPAPVAKATGSGKGSNGNGNGHVASEDRFPIVKEAIRSQIEAKRQDILVLERMLQTV